VGMARVMQPDILRPWRVWLHHASVGGHFRPKVSDINHQIDR